MSPTLFVIVYEKENIKLLLYFQLIVTEYIHYVVWLVAGRVEAGLPRLRLPPLSAALGNRTLGFADMVHELGAGVLLLPLVMVLANIAIAKAFCKQTYLV